MLKTFYNKFHTSCVRQNYIARGIGIPLPSMYDANELKNARHITKHDFTTPCVTNRQGLIVWNPMYYEGSIKKSCDSIMVFSESVRIDRTINSVHNNFVIDNDRLYEDKLRKTEMLNEFVKRLGMKLDDYIGEHMFISCKPQNTGFTKDPLNQLLWNNDLEKIGNLINSYAVGLI